ncbi:DUF6600 domain-containing protein [Aridibaculum aurantiacum]|uniref:DUF6600 domain-containing protein n=1 Tax=Aridibaculum aurantiacum TaxID=2810307 RepID=UPI001A9626E9|nr:DUF6600 domain-containing protein [Aridibaculum aurantiacum]
MKNLFNKLIVGAFIITMLSACGTSSFMMDDYDDYSYRQNRQVSYNMFYDQLSPYGNWVNYPGYGQVWIVNELGFRPYYTNGRWVYTNMGWTWASNYNWGWAPFHYGRWGHDPRMGWFWVPGLEWGPAWVNWRGNNSFYGWSPMAPNNWNRGYHNDPWVFVNSQYINHHNLSQFYVPQTRNQQLLGSTDVVRPPRTGTGYHPGPDRTEVERHTRQQIRPIRITDADRADRSEISNDEIRIYRPKVEKIKEPVNQQAERQPTQQRPGRIYLDNQEGRNQRFPGNNPSMERREFPNERPTRQFPTERPVRERQPQQERPIERNNFPMERRVPVERENNHQPQRPIYERPRQESPSFERPSRPAFERPAPATGPSTFERPSRAEVPATMPAAQPSTNRPMRQNKEVE